MVVSVLMHSYTSALPAGGGWGGRGGVGGEGEGGREGGSSWGWGAWLGVAAWRAGSHRLPGRCGAVWGQPP